TARDPSQRPALPREMALAGRQELRRAGDQRVLTRPSVEPGRSSYWGLDPMGRECGLADLSCTMRTLRMHFLGIEVADCSGAVLGSVVDTYPFDGGGELEMVVLRLRRFGERRMLPVSELRIEDGRIVVPFSQ